MGPGIGILGPLTKEEELLNMAGKIANNGIITMHAGDYFEAPLFLNVGEGCCPIQYVLEGDDKVFFGLMEPNQPFTHALIRKVLTVEDLDSYGNPLLVLRPEDTERIMPGLYYYEVKLLRTQNEHEYIDTVITKTKLYILE